MKRNRKLMIRTGLIFGVLMIAGVVKRASSADLPDGWLQDWDKALAQAKTDQKPILAVFSASWCPPCQMMVHDVYPQQSVKDFLKKYTAVYVDVDKNEKVAGEFKIGPIPTYIVASVEGKEEDRFEGARPAKDFVERIGAKAKEKELTDKIEKSPKDAQLYKDLGKLDMVLENTDEAVKNFEKAVELDPQDKVGVADDLFLVKTMPRSQDDLEKSAKLLAEFETKFPKSDLFDQVLFLRGVFAAQLDNLDDALKYLKECVQRFPDSDYAKQATEGVKQLEEAKKHQKGEEKESK